MEDQLIFIRKKICISAYEAHWLKKLFVLLCFVLYFFSSQTFSSENERSKMTKSAEKWISNELLVPINKIKVTPPDKRVRVSKCKSEIKFDFPFNNKETIRARCFDPSWQFFLRVSSNDLSTVEVLRPVTNTKKKQIPKKMVAVLVASSNLMRGERLRRSSVKLERKLKNKLPVDVFTQIDGLENQEMARNVKAGEVIRSIDIKAAKLIKKGDKVLFSIMAQGMLVKATVEALEDGKMGDQIELRNINSGITVIGVVTGKNKVTGL